MVLKSASSTGSICKPTLQIDLIAIAERMATVKHKILGLSGKGGVGKSTFSAQLAFALSAMDFQVGLLDIDICGPSIPKMLGLEGQQIQQSNLGWSPVYVESNRGHVDWLHVPHPNEAVIWRGPRKNGIIKQFLKDVYWGELDYVVVDAPPGTSDEHISIVQFLQTTGIDGATIVTTPQQVSLIDVRKEVNFCKKVGLEVLGVVEYMGGFYQSLSDFKFMKATEAGEQRDVTEWVLKYTQENAPEMLDLVAYGVVSDSSGGGAAKMCGDMGFLSLERSIRILGYVKQLKKVDRALMIRKEGRVLLPLKDNLYYKIDQLIWYLYMCQIVKSLDIYIRAKS